VSVNPTPPPSSTPASAPIGAILAGAAVTAVQAIVPLSNGVQPNYALMAATFLVVFGATLAMALYHVQVPSPIQGAVVAATAAAITSALDARAVPAQPQRVIPAGTMAAMMDAAIKAQAITPVPSPTGGDVLPPRA
jgi:hypothetical protein